MGKKARTIGFGVAVLSLFSVPAPGSEVFPLDLKLSPPGAVNSISLKVTAEATILGITITRSDSDTGTATGNVLASIGMTFDPATGAVTSVDTIEMTGGRAAFSDMNFDLNFGIGGSVAVAAKGISATFDTPNPPGQVSGGQFSGADHQVIIDQGTFSASGKGTVGGFLPSNPYDIDLTQDPVVTTSDTTGTIAVGPPVAAAGIATYEVTLTLPVAFDEVVFEQAGQAKVSVQGTGTFEAKATFTRPLRRTFVRGDCNADGRVNVIDPIRVLFWKFLGQPEPPCLAACDSTNDGAADISDAIFTLQYLFLAQDPPDAPGPLSCGLDPTPKMTCQAFPPCP